MRMTVGRKLLMLASLGALLTLVVGGVGFWGTRDGAERTRAMLANEAKIAEHSARMRANVLGMRRYEKDLFLNLGDAAKETDYVKKWTEQGEHLTARLGALAGVATLPADRERVAHMKT